MQPLRTLAITWVALLALPADGTTQSPARPPVHAGTPSGQRLRAPGEQDNFSIVIYGDRTGGRESGLQVLAEAVRMTNRLAPDFVMTVGDLVQGYNERGEWLAEMRQFKRHMKPLAMPWYPVAGNHDVYGPRRGGGDRVAEYREHFGPLYYSFDYKFAHVICLYSDEQLSYRRPEQQDMSDTQLAWLADDLAKTKAKIVFVFLHHPRWTRAYRGCNWPKVHALLARDGRVAAVFAGHIHRYRDDGVQDGIHYYTLATTGGNTSGLDAISFHHINHVRVWRDRIEMAVLPVGSVHGADTVLGSETDEIQRIAGSGWVDVDGDVVVSARARRTSRVSITLHNPSGRACPVTARFDVPGTWRVTPPRWEATLAPGEKRTFAAKVEAAELPDLTGRPRVEATLVYALASGRTQRIRRSAQLKIGLEDVSASLADPADGKNRVLQLDGRSAVRVDLPALDDAVTLECWVRGHAPRGRVGLVARTQNCNFSLFWTPKPHASVFVERRDGDDPKPGYLTLRAKADWSWSKWTHLALSYDGRVARYFVDGVLQSSAAGRDPRFNDDYPLLIGADPGRGGRAGSFFRGAIDEVRVSTVARYTADFTPERRFRPDAKTLALYHFDGPIDAIAIDASGRGHHGWAVGNPTRAREALPEADRALNR